MAEAQNDSDIEPAAAGTGPDITVNEMREWLRNWIGNATGQSPDSISESTAMVELGLSSREAVAMASDIEDLTGVTLTATVGFRHPTIEALATVIVGERAPGAHKLEMGPIADDIRAAIAVRHGVTVRDVLLTPAGAIPRTSSGKIGRRACRSAYLDGSLRSGKVANAFPDESD